MIIRFRDPPWMRERRKKEKKKSSEYNTKIPPVFPHILQYKKTHYQIEDDEKNVGILDEHIYQPK